MIDVLPLTLWLPPVTTQPISPLLKTFLFGKRFICR